MSGSLLMRLVSSSVAICNRAGGIVRDIMKQGDLGIIDKGIDDLQTEADRAVQRCIISSLNHKFPKIKIIGEEGNLDDSTDPDWLVHDLDQDITKHKCPASMANLSEEQVVVWVDPLDGTKEYTQGLLSHVTVLIGIAVEGVAVAGVIHQPFYNYDVSGCSELGRTVWGVPGLGVFGLDVKQAPANKRIITTTRSHNNAYVTSTLQAMNPDTVIRVGGAGHKVLLLLEGCAHAYVFPTPGTKKWDTCGPEAVLKATGGGLKDMFGEDIPYSASAQHMNSSGVLATAKQSELPWYISHVPDDVKNKLQSK